jgi:hypothetical protein
LVSRQPNQCKENFPKRLSIAAPLLDAQGGKLLGETTLIIEGKRFASVLDGFRSQPA